MRYKNLLVLLLIQLVYTFNVKAQKLDSLLREYDYHKTEDTSTLKVLLTLAYEYEDINPDNGIQFSNKAIALAQKLNKNDKLAFAYRLKGENSYLRNDYLAALNFIEKALQIDEQTGNKTGVAASLNDIGRVNGYLGNDTKALEYFQKAWTLDSLLNNKKEGAHVLDNIGWFYGRLFNYDKALEYYQQALKLYQNINNRQEVAEILNHIGKSYLSLNDFPKALKYLQQGLKLNEQLGNKSGIALNLYSIGYFYYELSIPSTALEYYQKASILYEQLNAKYYMSDVLYYIGNCYTWQSDSGRRKEYHEKAFEYYNKALSLNEQLNNRGGIAINLGGLAFNYIISLQFFKAMEYLKRALKMNQEINNQYYVADNLESIGLVFYTAPDTILVSFGINPAEKYIKAIEMLKRSLLIYENIGILRRQIFLSLRIYELYTKSKRYDSALVYYKHYFDLWDSGYNLPKQKVIVINELEYEFRKKEDSLKFHQRLTDEKLKEQVLIAKQEQQQLELSNKEKDLQKLAYLKTQADLQNEQLEKQQKEKQLTLSEKEKQLQLANVKTLTQEKHLNALKQQQQWFYIFGGLILIGLGGFYFFYRTRLHEVRLKTAIASERIEQQQKEAEFQRKLGDISLAALRSQMNPHFIFNCLNSIKLYTTQNDTAAATEYLSKFSKLIRLVMENSRNDRITLKSELEALRLYIEMEVMRFKEKLSYSISVDKEVETGYIEIPPLLLQPYVENAIWHGLMHKEEGGRIDITVSMQKNESLLEINIIDNGIGRAKSAEIGSKTATKHKSYGMKVTSERIALINQIYKTGANVSIHDLVHDDGRPAGTRVTIQIPV